MELRSLASRTTSGHLMTVTKAKWLAAVVVAVLYLGSVTSHWYISSDSALYLLLAQSLSQGNGYTLWGHPQVHVPPGYPVLLALLMCMGLGHLVWLNLSMVLMSLATLWLAYRLVLEQASASLALAVVCAVALSCEMHQRSIQQLSDVPFMLLVSSGLWFFTKGLKGGKGWLEAGTLALVAGCWVRVVGFPLALAAGAGLLLEPRQVSRRRLWLNLVGLVAGVMLSLVLFYVAYLRSRGPLPAASYAHHFQTLAGRPMVAWLYEPVKNFYETGSHFSRLLVGQKTVPALALAIFWVPTLIGAWQYIERRRYVGVLATAGYIAAILLLRPMLSRYLLPVSPLLSLYFLEGVRWLAERRPMLHSRSQRVSFGCAILLVTLNLPKDLRLVYQLHHPGFVELCNGMWPPLVETARFLREHAQPGEMFLSATEQRPLAYLSGVPCLELGKSLTYQNRPPEEILRMLEDQRVPVVIFGPGNLSPYFEVLREAVVHSGDFQLVFDNDRFQVYRCLRPWMTARKAKGPASRLGIIRLAGSNL